MSNILVLSSDNTDKYDKEIHTSSFTSFFNIQFEYILNIVDHYSKLLGDRGVPFVFNITFVDFLSKINKLKDFVDMFMKAFIIMRNSTVKS